MTPAAETLPPGSEAVAEAPAAALAPEPAPSPAGPAPSGLKGRVLRAGKWTLGSQLVAQVLRLATNVVLARLLFPDAFGLMAVVNMLITALVLFSDIGINRAVVQSRRGDDPALLDTAWTVQVWRGFGLAAACVLAAGGIALGAHMHVFRAGTVYADPRLPWIITVFAISPAIQGFDSVRIAQSKRQMQLHTLTKIELAGQLASAVVMVLIAYATRSVWTLVFGAIAATMVRTWLSHRVLQGHRARLRIDRDALAEIMNSGKWIFLSSIMAFLAMNSDRVLQGHRARLRIDRDALAEIMNSGKWIFLSSIMAFLAMNSDRVLLGGLIDARAFGLYSIALLMANVLQGLATKMCISIVYPALAEVYRDRPHDLGRTIAKFQWGYDALVTSLAALLVTAAPALVGLLYDHRYHDAGWMLSVLALGAIGVRYQIVEECYQVVHRAQFATLASLIRLAALAAGIFVGQRLWGLPGAIAGVALTTFAAWPLAIWFKLRYRVFSWRAEALVVPAVVGGLACGWVLRLAIEWALPWRFAG
jgi:O-antigen/teichoic acid export membrane protein